ncbi:MAG: cytochrome c oxidase accessory protein CcoG [Povalibacter sp.]
MAVDEAEVGLYAAQKKIHAREVSGRFNRLRIIAMCALLGTFYGLPWLNWRGHQAVLFDLPARKFHIFGLTFFPQDFYLLTWLLVIAALSLFFFTALAGRLWCGYACPQTVWTEIFVWMERLTEGNRWQRIKLDMAPWSVNKVCRKTAKQTLWIVFALFTGITFVGFFTPMRTIIPSALSHSMGSWEVFWALFYGFATYGNAGYMREQVCKYMCPYARFQGAMFDRNTLVISYDTTRGEPRGSRKRGSDARTQGLGDCVDCTLCVQVCPTGIDIRKGLQMDCIACAACIDACDDVMDRMKAPRGLIRYATDNSMKGERTHVLRPRMIAYGSALLLLIAGFAFAVGQRRLLEVDVLRDRNALYRQVDANTLENVYTIRLINKDETAHVVHLSVRGLPDARIDMDDTSPTIEAGTVVSLAVRIRVPTGSVMGGRDIQIVVSSEDESRIETIAKARFIAPVTR